MKRIEGLIEGLKLFLSLDATDVDAQHDIIRAGLDTDKLTGEQIANLEEWGWHYDEENDCWGFFT